MNRVCSVFHQVVELCPRSEFEAAISEHNAERHARGFSCWSQFIAMQHCHLVQAKRSGRVSQGKLEFNLKLISIDASLIFLLERGLDWANYHRGKGVLKLHLALDHDGERGADSNLDSPVTCRAPTILISRRLFGSPVFIIMGGPKGHWTLRRNRKH